MKTGYLRQDDSCHWYAVPKEFIERFDMVMDRLNELKFETDEWHDAIDDFESEFGEYRTGGGISDYEIIL